MFYFFPIATAYAEQGGSTPAGAGIASFMPFIILIFVFYFLLIRPQQKRAKDHTGMLEKLQSGDTVVTTGGIYGKVISVKDDTVNIEIADKVRVKLQKKAVQSRKAGDGS